MLVELYTGTDCDPCVAADLALDEVLEAYPRDQVIALSFDQHTPAPDPLTSPASEERAEFQSDKYTPYLLLNGQPFDETGGPREEAEARFKSLSAALKTSLSTPTGVSMKLQATLTPDHLVDTHATVQIDDASALLKALTPKSPTPNATATTPPTKLVLNFALVEREVRFTGSTGIRFHSMVVRSMAKPSAEGFPVTATGNSSASFSFDPARVSSAQEAYLASFAKPNNFGIVHFPPHETELPLNDLGVAAWVEDVSTHHVVAAAYLPVEAKAQESASR